MRVVVQRVTRACVRVGGAVVAELGGEPGWGSTGQGLACLVGVTHDDGPAQVDQLARKVADLRILTGELSAADAGAPVLVVSQFTLYGDTRKGRRPTWNAAAPGPVAEPVVEAFAAALRSRGLAVAQGVFGADMQVELVNDGPMTILLEA